MRFIGLDLAWSSRNNTAAVVLAAEGPTAHWVAHAERLGNNQQILAFIRQVAAQEPALLAIDAPLIVPNAEGARPVDRQITHLFGRYGAGCYPAYRNRPGSCTRGEALVEALAEDGFVQDPYVSRRAAIRSAFEVYPHPAMLALFHLKRTLQYKARPTRSLHTRQSELARLLAYLQTLSSGEPAMSVPAAVSQQDVFALQGSRFKRYEDLLDAAVCAYIAYYAWYWGPAGYEVYGDLTQGYILVPMTEWLRQRLASRESEFGHRGREAGV